jgi:hypothetical protein
VAVAVVANLTFGLHLVRSMADLDELELSPIAALAAEIPEHARVHCLGVGSVERVLFRRPLEQTCHTIVQLRTRGYSGPAFAGTGHNALRFRDSVPAWSLGRIAWQTNIQTLAWDYLLVRGSHAAPRAGIAEPISAIDARGDAASWTLYRVARATEVPADIVQLSAGGSGGTAGQTWCGDGRVVESLAVDVRAGALGLLAARADCRRLRIRGSTVAFEGDVESGPLFGKGRPSLRIACPVGQVLVGLHGRADTLVRAVGPICQTGRELEAQPGGRGVKTRRGKSFGDDEGEPFELVCPQGQVVRGLSGRGGALVDNVGVVCASLPPKAAQ